LIYVIPSVSIHTAFADSTFRCTYIGTHYAIHGFPPPGYEPLPEYTSFEGFKPNFRILPLTDKVNDNNSQPSSLSSEHSIEPNGLQIKLQLADVSNQQLRQVTYIVNLTKISSDDPKSNGTQVLSSIFRSAVGNLTLNLHPSLSKASLRSNVTVQQQPSHPVIHATEDPLLRPLFKIWFPEQLSVQNNSVINIDNVTLGNGRYHLRVDILGMAGEREAYCMFDYKNMPKFDTYFTVDARGRVSAVQTVPELSMNTAIIMAISFVGLVVWTRITSRHQKKR
jgi:hypothetical protein